MNWLVSLRAKLLKFINNNCILNNVKILIIKNKFRKVRLEIRDIFQTFWSFQTNELVKPVISDCHTST